MSNDGGLDHMVTRSLSVFQVVTDDLEIPGRLKSFVALRSRHGCLEVSHVRDYEIVVVDVHVPDYHLWVWDNLIRLDLSVEILVRLGVRGAVVLSLLSAELLQVRIVASRVRCFGYLGAELVVLDEGFLKHHLAKIMA